MSSQAEYRSNCLILRAKVILYFFVPDTLQDPSEMKQFMAWLKQEVSGGEASHFHRYFLSFK